MTEVLADAILALQLRRLVAVERGKIIRETTEIEAQLAGIGQE